MKKVRWELHILPMMRSIDRDHMLRLGPNRRLDLYDYDQVRARATPDGEGNNIFLNWIEDGAMPPPNAGGPWPEEWIALFKRWIKDEYARLELTAGSYAAVRTGGTVKVTARVELPSVEDAAWLDRTNLSSPVREYNLWHEPNGEPDEPFPTVASDSFEAGPEVTMVVINDKAGRHEVMIR
jgi:hypothetical protein